LLGLARVDPAILELGVLNHVGDGGEGLQMQVAAVTIVDRSMI